MTRIFVAGHNGMVGSALVRCLENNPENDLIVAPRKSLDLTDKQAVQDFLEIAKPDQVYLAAAKVGGILANNTYPADFIYQNLAIQMNVIDGAFKSGIRKLLFLGSSCIYPKFADQPIKEEALLTGALEPTNEPYAIAKIAGIKLCESYNRQYGETHGIDYRSVMPTNLYGPGDNYHAENSHVIPGMLRRFHEAKLSQAPSVVVWGSGAPMREFLYVDDMAAASVHVMNLDSNAYEMVTQPMLSHLNVGSGADISIKDLAYKIKDVVGYAGEIKFDLTKPDGTSRKLMDSSAIRKTGWKPEIGLEVGLRQAYANYVQSIDKGMGREV